jgi:hypothetical protein
VSRRVRTRLRRRKMSNEEMVEHWLVCKDCGDESERKMIPRRFAEILEAAGTDMSPSWGRCPDCRLVVEAQKDEARRRSPKAKWN